MAAIAKHRAGGRCEACGSDGPLDAHHIRPVGEGGPFWDLANLRALCRNCQRAQHPGWVDDDEVDAALRDWLAEGAMLHLVQVAAMEHKLYETAQAESSRLSAEVAELRDENLRLLEEHQDLRPRTVRARQPSQTRPQSRPAGKATRLSASGLLVHSVRASVPIRPIAYGAGRLSTGTIGAQGALAASLC